MENISSIISSIILVVGLLYVVCLGWSMGWNYAYQIY